MEILQRLSAAEYGTLVFESSTKSNTKSSTKSGTTSITKARVHSLFPQGINLLSETGDILYLGTKAAHAHAIALLDDALWRRGARLKVGDSVLIDPLAKTLRFPHHTVDCRFGKRQEYKPPARLILSDLGWLEAVEGLKSHIKTLATPDWRRAFVRISAHFSQFLKDSRPAHLSAIFGLGPGLTPSGDDFLVGICAALWAWRKADFRKIAQHLFKESTRTGDISRDFIALATRGYFPNALVQLSRAKRLDLALITRCGSDGHTSGLDGILGFLWGTWSFAPHAPPKQLREGLITPICNGV